ncbi:MAG: hypothetical protein Q4D53_07700, partial [Leptotrichiaceae bacterium]|nr:hypothetical protein [Leptotrichiaceae bacterium]
KSSDNKEKAEIAAEIDKIIAENTPYMLIDDKIYEYYLINPKIKGLKIGKYEEYILHSPFFEK